MDKRHRNRQRPPGTLHERLVAMARLARAKAASLPDCIERDSLVRKADLSERTAALEEWLMERPPRAR